MLVSRSIEEKRGETNSYILGKGPDISARQGLYICNLPLLSLNLFRLVSRLGFLQSVVLVSKQLYHPHQAKNKHTRPYQQLIAWLPVPKDLNNQIKSLQI